MVFKRKWESNKARLTFKLLARGNIDALLWWLLGLLPSVRYRYIHTHKSGTLTKSTMSLRYIQWWCSVYQTMHVHVSFIELVLKTKAIEHHGKLLFHADILVSGTVLDCLVYRGGFVTIDHSILLSMIVIGSQTNWPLVLVDQRFNIFFIELHVAREYELCRTSTVQINPHISRG